jgi:prepilin signal peptidase PulO-like enzyme (type II secretory pathway)
VWLFALGACVGSFLNVVIYRLPAGMSLIHPPSRCPACGHPIRWYDNVPIFGWLWLRGRCRDCRAAISPRYPLVEFAVAALFVIVAVADWWLWKRIGRSGQSLLPGMAPVWGYLTDVAAMCTIFTFGLIDYDGGRIRRIWLWPVLLIAATIAGSMPPGRWPWRFAFCTIFFLAIVLRPLLVS